MDIAVSNYVFGALKHATGIADYQQQTAFVNH